MIKTQWHALKRWLCYHEWWDASRHYTEDCPQHNWHYRSRHGFRQLSLGPELLCGFEHQLLVSCSNSSLKQIRMLACKSVNKELLFVDVIILTIHIFYLFVKQSNLFFCNYYNLNLPLNLHEMSRLSVPRTSMVRCTVSPILAVWDILTGLKCPYNK